MEKFLNIAVTGEGKQIVSCTDVKLIEAGTATSTVITYGSGKVTTITHASVGAASGTNSGTQFRSIMQDAMRDALSTAWFNVAEVLTPKYAVSDITTV
tara:strand:+ start:299 stop:592 length:294 start_codon:yes stop_codon:yes gene_type:complete